MAGPEEVRPNAGLSGPFVLCSGGRDEAAAPREGRSPDPRSGLSSGAALDLRAGAVAGALEQVRDPELEPRCVVVRVGC